MALFSHGPQTFFQLNHSNFHSMQLSVEGVLPNCRRTSSWIPVYNISVNIVTNLFFPFKTDCNYFNNEVHVIVFSIVILLDFFLCCFLVRLPDATVVVAAYFYGGFYPPPPRNRTFCSYKVADHRIDKFISSSWKWLLLMKLRKPGEQLNIFSLYTLQKTFKFSA